MRIVSPGCYSPFQTSWWLEAVVPGQWGEVTLESKGTLVARWPYYRLKKWGYTFLVMPRLTPVLGPWLHPLGGKYTSRISQERKLMNELLEKLPPFDMLWQNLHYSITDWLPFYWQGFRQTTKYTYVIEDLSDLEAVWNGMKKSTREVIRKAEKSGLQVIESDDLEAFLHLNELTFARQNLPLPYSKELVRRIDAACKLRSARKIFLTIDSRGRIHAGRYVVYNKQAACALMDGSDPELRQSGGLPLAVWESIKFASTTSKVYDFDGSMKKNLELAIRGFGGVQKPFHQILKCNSNLLQVAFDFINLIDAWDFIKKRV